MNENGPDQIDILEAHVDALESENETLASALEDALAEAVRQREYIGHRLYKKQMLVNERNTENRKLRLIADAARELVRDLRRYEVDFQYPYWANINTRGNINRELIALKAALEKIS